MELKLLSTNKLLFNVKEKDFASKMIKRSAVFDFKDEKILIYIVLVYDLNSEIRRNIKEYLRRKTEAGEAAGFKRDEKTGFFEKKIEDMMVGENDQFNKAVIQYTSWMYERDFKHLVVLEFNYHKLAIESMQKWDSKSNTLMMDMKNEMQIIEDKLFGGEEVMNMRRALYEGTDRTRLRLRKENEIDEFELNGLVDWSPYGDYKPELIKFGGDHIPDKYF
jgi:hypothetical protein